MQNRWVVALAIVCAPALGLGAPAARAQAFNQGPCSGIICGFGSNTAQPSTPKPAQNCGGLLCDTGAARAFEAPPAAPPAQTADVQRQPDDAAAKVAQPKHRPRHKRVAKTGGKADGKTAPDKTASGKSESTAPAGAPSR